MYPVLFHLGRVAVSTEGLLVAFGLLCGLQVACLLAPRCGLDPDRIWNLGLTGLLTLFLGERMLVIAFNLRDFIDHPVWMLGLTLVRDERYFYGGALLAVCACVGYIIAWRLPWRGTLDTLAPGAGLVLACLSLGSLAAGADFGRPTTAAWGFIYTSRSAARTAGTPLGIPLIPTTLYAALLHLAFAAFATWLILRFKARQPGVPAAFWLFAAGLSTVLLADWRYQFPQEVLIAGVFTPAQLLGVLAIVVAALLWLQPASTIAPASPQDAAL